ncbi:FAD/NAD(P)-binding domain-containing protein [Auricularia subglabra TFB-10046 SS5]|nr:FAD/NAD(P)-binding domain-containing protein [Auricularia subglabra TFB-10046 SS5]
MEGTPSHPLRIAIIGGGVAGLTLASTLAKFNKDSSRLAVSIYEADGSFMGEVGAGILIFGWSFEIMKSLGLVDELGKIDQAGKGVDDYSFVYRRSDEGPEGHKFAYRPFGRGATYHRADFRSVHARHVTRLRGQTTVHFGKRLRSARATRNGHSVHELTFTDGTTAVCDILVGADGVRSLVRTAMFDLATNRADESLRAYGPAMWSGECVYRALVPSGRLAEEWERIGGTGPHRLMRERVIYSGKRKKIVAYPIQNGSNFNMAIYLSEGELEGQQFDRGKWVEDVDPFFLRDEFKTWETEVRALVNCITKASRWAIHVVKPLPFFVYNRIAVVGDAAHAMTPHNGSGANQALEDAYLLGRLLAHPMTAANNVEFALQAYDSVRTVDTFIKDGNLFNSEYAFILNIFDGKFAGGKEFVDSKFVTARSLLLLVREP